MRHSPYHDRDGARVTAPRVPAARLGEGAEIADLIAYPAAAAPQYLAFARVVIGGGAEAPG